MGIAALITWLLTAVGGFVMLGTWVAKGGVRNPSSTRLSPPLIFGHFALAAIGLVLWIVYLIADSTALAWTAVVLLVPVALLGFAMLVRWLPTVRGTTAGASDAPPERSFPVPVVVGHGLIAVITVVLALLAALNAS
ncbi:MAG TPA: hypothetical protein VFV67_13210 [Actinophytocola sp.]|uniref:hypothetical protein n=1 Tax=Actinophytocola sp. TaxID=1872138 RepID=UPI002DBEE324|nr:hypothetical protein [Actinophytocola sp.]HEU5471606.1 hypothetical protein [Actinophytocola sp.]